jgi:peptide/nickel transport system permease protein
MIVRLHPMAKLILTRVAISVVALIVLSSMLFWILEFLPGDFADAVLGRGRTAARLAEIREAFGLNRPAYVRYFEWMANALVLDFGRSWIWWRPVWEIIEPRFYNSMLLAALTALFAVPLGLALGTWAAARKGTVFDRTTTLGTLVLFSVPDFVLAYFLAFLFVVTFRIFPAHTAWVRDISWPDRLHGLALPVLVLTLISLAPIMRLTRASILNVLGDDYIEMAHLKGMSPWRIVLHHALPNAVAPIINVTLMVTAHLIVGVVIIETLFSYRGMGSYMVESVVRRDLPVVQACGMIFAAIYILLFLIADIISVLSNPRLRHPNREPMN